MAEAVFILGAGASAGSGAPLMSNFLDVAEDILRAGGMQRDQAHFEQVFKSIAALKAVQAQFPLDTDNLEAVFSAFEMGAMVGRLGSIQDQEEVEATRRAMVRVIARTLQDRVLLPVSKGRVHPPWEYEEFVKALARIRSPSEWQSGKGKGSALITLNYDLGLDYALFCARIPCAYCLESKDASPGSVKLLKLHGSLNWGVCRSCERVVPWDLSEYFSTHHYDVFGEESEGETRLLTLADELATLKHCDTGLAEEPVVVPPTWNKSDNGRLRNVWRAAARELAEAKYVAFVGYSFPETDLYFRYLLALGMAGDSRIRKVLVWNPDETARDRLLAMLSPTLRKRVVCWAVPFTTSQASALPSFLELGPARRG